MNNAKRIIDLIESETIVTPLTGKAFKVRSKNLYEDSFGETWFFEEGVLAKKLENHANDKLDLIKNFFKRFPRFYRFLVLMISPVNPNLKYNRDIGKKIESIEKTGVALNLGSGSYRIHPDVLNVDISNFKNVDIVADISKLPFANSSVDCVINNAVLEHVTNPEECVREFSRVLKDDGVAFIFVPFMQGFHASPHDYWRWTDRGCYELFSKYFSSVTVAPSGGPTSGALWILQDWLATIFSIFTPKLHSYFFILFMLLLFPLKFLDILLIKHPASKNISSGFTIIARKTSSSLDKHSG